MSLALQWDVDDPGGPAIEFLDFSVQLATCSDQHLRDFDGLPSATAAFFGIEGG